MYVCVLVFVYVYPVLAQLTAKDEDTKCQLIGQKHNEKSFWYQSTQAEPRRHALGAQKLSSGVSKFKA